MTGFDCLLMVHMFNVHRTRTSQEYGGIRLLREIPLEFRAKRRGRALRYYNESIIIL